MNPLNRFCLLISTAFWDILVNLFWTWLEHKYNILLWSSKMTPSFACEVWENCGVSNSCKLERLQLEAAIIIAGLPIFTNTEYLNRETGWERLEERRTRRKLQLFYNIQNGSTHPIFTRSYPPNNPKYDYLSSSKWQRYHSVDFLWPEILSSQLQ